MYKLLLAIFCMSFLIGYNQITTSTSEPNEKSESPKPTVSMAQNDAKQSNHENIGDEAIKQAELLVKSGLADMTLEALVAEPCDETSFETIKALIKAGANVNSRSTNGWSILMFAATKKENLKVLQTLIKAGADVNARTTDGTTALMICIHNAKDEGLLKELINAGADVNARNNENFTALMIAAVDIDRSEIIEILLSAGADVNARADDGRTALIAAARFNTNPDVILTLLKAGANPKAKDIGDNNAFYYAQKNTKLINTDVYWKLNDAQYK